MEKIVDVENMKFMYNNENIYIIMANDDSIWFRANDVLHLLGYIDKKQALRINVENKNKKQLQELSDTYKSLYKNVQGQTLFINSEGFNNLIIKSNKPDAIEIQRWISNEVLPALAEKGRYVIGNKTTAELKKVRSDFEKVLRKKKKLSKEVKKYKNNQKKLTYPKGSAIYIMRPKIGSKKKIIKIGRTGNPNVRFANYNTTLPDNVQDVIVIPVVDMVGTEMCLKGLLHKYIYRERKEYYKCSIKDVLKALDTCIFSTEGKHITCYKNMSRMSSVDIMDDNAELYEFESDNQSGGSVITLSDSDAKLKLLKYITKISALIEKMGGIDEIVL
jgi:prophage antirepressor-like protein